MASFEFDTDGFHDLLPQIEKIDNEEGRTRGRGDKQQVVVKIDYDLCDYTGVCTQVCPEEVLEFRNAQSLVVKPEQCTECWICVENCVSGAIEIG